MKIDWQFFKTPSGHLVLVGLLIIAAAIALRWQHRQRQTQPLPAAASAAPAILPRTFTREGVPFAHKTHSPALPVTSAITPGVPVAVAKPTVLPLTLFAAAPEPARSPTLPSAPYGRLIPCETIVALESNRLETPVIGLVSENVWHDGNLVIPAGAEVHGRAALDRTRERLAAQGAWRIVWRTPGRDNGTELSVEGLALDREFDGSMGTWGEHDGSAGLRGRVVKTQDERELKLFAATFLATATAALQDTRMTAGLLGETSVPAATVRNATLAGTSAVLREYAQQIREAITRDGLYLHVPAGKPFYLYVTQTLDLSQARRASGSAQPKS